MEIISIDAFQQGIMRGIYSDKAGTARLVINGRTSYTYFVHIDRRVVTATGKVISLRSLLKEYGDDIMIEFEDKNGFLPSASTYRAQRRVREAKMAAINAATRSNNVYLTNDKVTFYQDGEMYYA